MVTLLSKFRLAFLISICLANVAPAQASDLVIQAEVQRSGDYMAFAFDSLWTMSDGRLIRVNASDNSVVEIELDGYIGSNRGIAAGEGAVWVPDTGSMRIFKVDPSTNRLVGEISTFIFGRAGSIGVGEGSVWVVTADDHDKSLTRYDAVTGAEQAVIDLPEPGVGVLVAYGSVWVTSPRADVLFRIDPATNRVLSASAVDVDPEYLAAGEDSIWITNRRSSIIHRIDGATGEHIAEIRVHDGTRIMHSDIDVGGGFVWMAMRGFPVIKIDPERNAVAGTFKGRLGMRETEIRYGADSLWLSGSSLLRVAPP